MAASQLPTDSLEWVPFVGDVLGLPLTMLEGIQQVVKRKTWMMAKDPLQQVRNAAMNWAGRQFRIPVGEMAPVDSSSPQWELIESLIANPARSRYPNRQLTDDGAWEAERP